jgi:hypothetical protein
MKKIVILSILFISSIYGIEYSLRIRSLGTDFAYLVPDYETDLYLDPNILGERHLVGLSLEDSYLPVTLRLLTERFGWYGQYWGHYSESQDLFYGAHGKSYTMTVKDLWMLDLRGKLGKFLASDVWNIYNDGVYSYAHSYWDTFHFETARMIEYLFGVSGSWRIKDNLKIVTNSRVGIYYTDNEHVYYDEYTAFEKMLLPFSCMFGLHYQNTGSPYSFTSWYFLTGGPLTMADIEDLPFSIWSNIDDGEIQYSWFAQTWSTKIGFAKGISLEDRGMFVFGLRDTFLLQNTSDIEDVTNDRGIRNVLTMPLGIEYTASSITLRIGTHIDYEYTYRKIWDYWNNTNTLRVYNRQDKHSLEWGYSFGMQWRLTEKFIIDMYNNNMLTDVDEWALYLKYMY